MMSVSSAAIARRSLIEAQTVIYKAIQITRAARETSLNVASTNQNHGRPDTAAAFARNAVLMESAVVDLKSALAKLETAE
jgi:hypothetical protein